jgi:hypothetical protein
MEGRADAPAHICPNLHGIVLDPPGPRKVLMMLDLVCRDGNRIVIE